MVIPGKRRSRSPRVTFAVQTRKQELIEEHIHLTERIRTREKLKESEIELSRNLYERGVSESGFARIRSKGDTALFGKCNYKWPLADFLPIIIATARDLATGITNFNVVKEDMQGEEVITGEHVLNNQDVRELLVRRGIVPETLGPEQDLKRLERRAKPDERRIAKKSVLSAGDCSEQEW